MWNSGKTLTVCISACVLVSLSTAWGTTIDDFSDSAVSSNIWLTHPDAGGGAGWSRITFDTERPGMAYLQDGDQDGSGNGTWMMNQTTSNFRAEELTYSFDFDLGPDWGGSANFYLTPDADTQVFNTQTRLRVEIYEHDAATDWIEWGLFRNNNSASQITLWGGRSDAGSYVETGTVSLTLTPNGSNADYSLVITPDQGSISTTVGNLGGSAGVNDPSWNNGVYIGFQAARREGSGTHGFAIDNVVVIPEPSSALTLMIGAGLLMCLRGRSHQGHA